MTFCGKRVEDVSHHEYFNVSDDSFLVNLNLLHVTMHHIQGSMVMTVSKDMYETDARRQGWFLCKVEHMVRLMLGQVALPPGPPVFLMPWTLNRLFDRKVHFFQDIQEEYGDMVYMRLGQYPSYLVSDPELIEEVLMRQGKSFKKDAFMERLQKLLGQGLLTSEDPLWRQQRKLAAPSLKRKQIMAYADDMVRYTQRYIDTLVTGQVRDMHEDMMEVTLRIVVNTLFGLEMEEDVACVGKTIHMILGEFEHEMHSMSALLPQSVQTPRRRRFKQAIDELHATIMALIAKRRASGEEGGDLLSRFLMARDEDGEHMNDEQLRDEVITMFLAGHETTALTVTYTWHLLAMHPECRMLVQREVDDVLEGRCAGFEDVAKLKYTMAVIKESMRLKPPAWMIGREAKEDVELGGWSIPKGAQVLMSQWVVHRDERWFPDALSFSPQRWLDGSTDEIPRFAYFPFGGGARVCIGNHFALMEAALMVATMAQRWTYELAIDEYMTYVPAVTMRPAGPVLLRVKSRAGVAA